MRPLVHAQTTDDEERTPSLSAVRIYHLLLCIYILLNFQGFRHFRHYCFCHFFFPFICYFCCQFCCQFCCYFCRFFSFSFLSFLSFVFPILFFTCLFWSLRVVVRIYLKCFFYVLLLCWPLLSASRATIAGGVLTSRAPHRGLGPLQHNGLGTRPALLPTDWRPRPLLL